MKYKGIPRISSIMEYIDDILMIAKIEDRLKRIRRTGWLKSKIHHAETVSEHMHHTILMALLLRKYLDTEVDWVKVYILSAIHDMGEAYIGDIPHPLKTEADKSRELEYLNTILRIFRLENLLNEVEEAETLEHYIYKFSELLSTYSQGIIYLERGYRDPYIFEILSNTLERMEKIAEKTNIDTLRKIVSELKDYYRNIV